MGYFRLPLENACRVLLFMEQLRRKKIHFRRLLERNFPQNPLHQVAKRSYLATIDTLINDKLENFLKVHTTNRESRIRTSSDAISLPKQGHSPFVPEFRQRASSQIAGRNVRTPKILKAHEFGSKRNKTMLRSLGGLEVDQRLER